MITVEQAYERYIAKVEKNATNDSLSTDKARFVLKFNEEQNRFIENLLDKRGDDDIRYIQNFLVLDKKIPYTSKLLDNYSFPLPKNYLDISNVYAFASSGKCTNKKIYLFEIKDENKNEILQDPFNKPSFKWRESCYTVNSNKISVYTDNFTVDSIILSYYRYPNRIALVNPNDPESPFNENIKIEWDDKALDRIITSMVASFLLSEQNQAYTAQKQQAQIKN